MKHLRTGDVLGGAWLWSFQLRRVVRLFASSVRHRSPLRARVAWNETVGMTEGTVRGLATAW
jgi:hypothetical protein